MRPGVPEWLRDKRYPLKNKESKGNGLQKNYEDVGLGEETFVYLAHNPTDKFSSTIFFLRIQKQHLIQTKCSHQVPAGL